jgi:hypothetical protein
MGLPAKPEGGDYKGWLWAQWTLVPIRAASARMASPHCGHSRDSLEVITTRSKARSGRGCAAKPVAGGEPAVDGCVAEEPVVEVHERSALADVIRGKVPR